MILSVCMRVLSVLCHHFTKRRGKCNGVAGALEEYILYYSHFVTAQSMANIEVVQFTIAVRSGFNYCYFLCVCVCLRLCLLRLKLVVLTRN